MAARAMAQPVLLPALALSRACKVCIWPEAPSIQARAFRWRQCLAALPQRGFWKIGQVRAAQFGLVRRAVSFA
jgi:hypothetical protein